MAFLLSSLITNNWFNFVLKSLYVFFSNRDNFQVTYLSIYLSVHLSVTSEGVLIPAPHPRIKIKRGSETNLERKRFTKNGWDAKGGRGAWGIKEHTLSLAPCAAAASGSQSTGFLCTEWTLWFFRFPSEAGIDLCWLVQGFEEYPEEILMLSGKTSRNNQRTFSSI